MKAWHNLAHGTRISTFNRENQRTAKTLIRKGYLEMLNLIKRVKSISQAYDEGSIPFTRSYALENGLRR